VAAGAVVATAVMVAIDDVAAAGAAALVLAPAAEQDASPTASDATAITLRTIRNIGNSSKFPAQDPMANRAATLALLARKTGRGC
jgi:hypothetical protein